jgi:hypothetical protein
LQFVWLFFYLFGNTGVWTQGLVLARQVLCTWAMLPSSLVLISFWIGSCVFVWGCPQTLIVLPVPSQIARLTGTCHNAWFVDWSGISITFCLGWPWIVILPSITGMYHHT